MYPSYIEYCRLKTSGLRDQANQMAKDVVAEYSKNPNEEFVTLLCESARDELSLKLNHILWRGIVFPYIQSKLDSDPAANKCLIQTIQNLYSDKHAHEMLNWTTEFQLTERLLKVCPENERAITKRQKVLSNWLKYTIHEWPSGVLYGHGGATDSQCGEILEAMAELRSIDGNGTYRQLCDDVEDRTNQYRLRLFSG